MSVGAEVDAPTAAHAPKISIGDTGRSITDFVNVAHKKMGFYGAVLAAKNGKIVAATAVGKLDENRSEPLETTSLFEIASCTKIFTAMAILRLQEAGKLKLDDPISEHLPGVPENCNGITIRHLLQHTSGIPGTNTHGSGENLSEVLPTFLEGGPRHSPGTHWEYWNQGYSLLSEIISRVSGKPYDEYCRDEIFVPCQMTKSRFTGQKPPANVTVATGHSSRGVSRSALDHPYGSYGFQYRGMGGLVTNLANLWKWDRAIAGGRLLNSDSIKEMTSPGLGDYGLGWFIAATADGKQVLRHGGSVRGFLAEIRRYPSEDGCLIVLSNRDSVLPMTLVESGCEAILFGKQPQIEFPISVSEKLASRIEGEYEDDRGRRFEITKEDQFVQAKILWGGPTTNGYIGKDNQGAMRLYMFESYEPAVFKSTDSVEFDFDGRGKAKSVSIVDVRFDRVRTR